MSFRGKGLLPDGLPVTEGEALPSVGGEKLLVLLLLVLEMLPVRVMRLLIRVVVVMGCSWSDAGGGSNAIFLRPMRGDADDDSV